MRAHATARGDALHESGLVRTRVRIEGLVQGVGFRPFVYSLATRFDLAGFVANDTRGVLLEVEGARASIARFIECLQRDTPPLATIERLVTDAVRAQGEVGFAIVASSATGERQVLISPDIGSCDDCLREILDPADRRYRYPFTNCTNCGPRFTIVRNVPYDRPLTTMAGFAMCPQCAREYHDPHDRRFHAQPISCPACGPRMRLLDRRGTEMEGDPVHEAARLLRLGHIVAVKGLGGYHLAADATNETAVNALRRRKHREDKPFAVLVRDPGAARALAGFGAVEEHLLLSPRRPIVLVRRLANAALAESVTLANRFVGVMLPYTPLHHLLSHEVRGPCVLTSGNISDEPIAYEDGDAFARLAHIADFYLTHDRPVHTRTDDSVVRVVADRVVPIRRARGYAPRPLVMPWDTARPILACGGELKNTFCLAKDRYAFLSHHIGDLGNFQTFSAFREGIDHFIRLFDVTPEVVAYDLHPEYLSTKYALDLAGVAAVGVQHHHAHVAACLADNREAGPVIGVAFDGLGYGSDGTLWGGEFLLADLAAFERVGHFEAVPMPGGSAAIKQPWRMATAYLDAAYGDGTPDTLGVVARNRAQWRRVVALSRTGINSPRTSSVGRLFDAIAALLGVRDAVNYEGQAAVELEQRADPAERWAYRMSFERCAPYRVRGTDLVRAVVDDLHSGTPVGLIAARFHNTLARLVVEVCDAIRTTRGLSTVALSGGVFQNALLLMRTVNGLEECGFRVLTHNRVPANDGGISFGQAAVAAARDRRRLLKENHKAKEGARWCRSWPGC